MEKYVKKVAILLSVLLCICFVPFSAFADVLDDKLSPGEKLMYQNFNYVWGQETSETGITCPKCGTAIRKIDRFTCPNCGYNAMVVDSDGKTTFTAGGGKANGSGVGRPKAYKEDNTPAVLSTGEYTMYVHPTFVRKSTGLPFVNGTQQSKNSVTGELEEGKYFTSTVERNRISVSQPVEKACFGIKSEQAFAFGMEKIEARKRNHAQGPLSGSSPERDFSVSTSKWPVSLNSWQQI